MNARRPRPLSIVAVVLVGILAACVNQASPAGSGSPSPSQPAPSTVASSPSTPPSAGPSTPASPSASPKPVAWTKPVAVDGLAGCGSVVATVDDRGATHLAADCRNDLRYATSSDGSTWKTTRFAFPKDRGDFGPQLAFDGNTLYLASTRYDTTEGGCGDSGLVDVGVYYRSRSLPDGEWSQPQRLGAVADELVAFRVSDGLRAIVANQKTGKLSYVTLSGGTLNEQPLSGAVGGDVSMRIGDDGKPRIVYGSDAGISYGTLESTGKPSGTSVVSSSDYAYGPSLVLAPGNVPTVLYAKGIHGGGCAEPDPPADAGMYVATFDGGAWTSTRLTKDEGEGSLTVDPDTGEIHVLLSNPGLVHFSKVPGGDWKKETLRKAGVTSPVIRQDPATGNLVVAYSGDDGIEVMTRR